jgi:phosphoadenosine phosphosulfate reductase
MSAISLYARATPGFEDRVANALEVLRLAATEHPGKVVQATSLGVEDMVITDLIARHELAIAIGTLETGKLHAETVALIPTIESHYAGGHAGARAGIKIEVYEPVVEAVVTFVRKHGERAMYESIDLRKNCCAIRKIEPLSRMLKDRSAWVTGMRREQSNDRNTVGFSELDDKGRTKYNPLADWSLADVWHYIDVNGVPYNPLHDQFFPSIGCAPCTRAVAVGEDFRAGRWWWETDGAKECGLHVHDDFAQQVSMIGTHA